MKISLQKTLWWLHEIDIEEVLWPEVGGNVFFSLFVFEKARDRYKALSL